MARKKRRSSSRSRSRSSSGRSSSSRRRSPSRRRSSSSRRKPKNWGGLRFRKFDPDAGGFNPEVAPKGPPSMKTRTINTRITVGRDPNARDSRNAFVGCAHVAKITKCAKGRNPRVVAAAALRAAATALTGRGGSFAALNLGSYGGGGRRRRRRRR